MSVHTLEIGYDVPEVRVAIILATSSNMNQIVQRIGRTLRKTAGKDTALIYTIPASIISCNYEDVLTGRVHAFDFTNLC